MNRHRFLAELWDERRLVAIVHVAAGENPYVRDIVSFDSEDATRADEEYSRALVRVKCPSCGRTCAPLLALFSTRYIGSGWEWVGIDYQQPYGEYLCRCRCGHRYRLHIYTPQ